MIEIEVEQEPSNILDEIGQKNLEADPDLFDAMQAMQRQYQGSMAQKMRPEIEIQIRPHSRPVSIKPNSHISIQQ